MHTPQMQNQEQIHVIDTCEKKKLRGPLLPLTFHPFFFWRQWLTGTFPPLCVKTSDVEKRKESVKCDLGRTLQIQPSSLTPAICSSTRLGCMVANEPELPCQPNPEAYRVGQSRSPQFGGERWKEIRLVFPLALPGLLRHGHSCCTTSGLVSFV